MSPRIEQIEDAGPDRRARRLVFDDGTEPRVTSAAAVKELSLEVGSVLPGDSLEAALAECEPRLARDRAIALLGYRERSEAELGRKLRESGYGRPTADAVVSRMAELGLVDDERFAGMWARTRTSAGFGPKRISRELAEKGVAPEVVSAALRELDGDGDQLTRARAALRGKVATDRKSRDRLVRRLVSRGFDMSVALRAIDEVTGPETGL